MPREIHGPESMRFRSAIRLLRSNPEEGRIDSLSASFAPSPRVPKCAPRQARLDSWKVVASYLGREVRTVQRWEKREGLPVRRQIHRKGCTVYAFKDELDAWLASRSPSFSQPRPMQRGLKPSTNGLNPSSQMIRQMFSSFCQWLAVVSQQSLRIQGLSRSKTSEWRVSLAARESEDLSERISRDDCKRTPD